MPSFRIADFFHRLTHWEYWPMGILYIPYLLKVFYYAAREGTFGFMTAVNPGMQNSGFFNDSKVDTLNLFPKASIPITIYATGEESIHSILSQIDSEKINYPLILKPDIGERGAEVKKILSEAELLALLSLIDYPYQIQEFISYPMELGVFWYRYPENEKGTVNSLTIKKYLNITGDGTSSVEALILKDPRSRFQIEKLNEAAHIDMNHILDKGEERIINEIGNHSRGTTFLNGNPQIDDALIEAMNSLMDNVEGVFFGRADIKCQDLDALRALKDFKIIEFNGVKAEPTHIYDPDYPLIRGLIELSNNVNIIYKIAKQNQKKGIRFKKGAFWAFIDYARNKPT